MSHIIIGVHGMGNKPPEKTLQAWWEASIREGLRRINKPKQFFNFKLFYWSPYLHPEPLQRRMRDKKHPLYIEEPYFRSEKSVEKNKPSRIRPRILNLFSKQLDKIFLKKDFTINHASIAGFIIRHFFSDLELYYGNYRNLPEKKNRDVKLAICSDLAALLHQHKRKKILLIAHSMGAIVAYDTLTQFATEVHIDTFVTIGAPLGLPVIKSRIIAESNKTGLTRNTILKTPENIISNWYNLSDLRDKIAVNYKLDDDFKENARHVRPADLIVANDYKFKGEKNPHKVYGYLRTLEMAGIISDFLDDYRYIPFGWFKIFQRIKDQLNPAPFIKNLFRKRSRRSHEQR